MPQPPDPVVLDAHPRRPGALDEAIGVADEDVVGAPLHHDRRQPVQVGEEG